MSLRELSNLHMQTRAKLRIDYIAWLSVQYLEFVTFFSNHMQKSSKALLFDYTLPPNLVSQLN